MHLTRLKQAQWTIYACADSETQCRLLDSVNSLDSNHQRKFAALVSRAAELGPEHVAKDACHVIEGKIWQFRAGDFRVLWFYDAGRVVICTHGFVKKKGKTPASEIRAAKSRHAAYLAAKQRGTLTCRESAP